ncbi:MAG: hypothetical protein QOC98_2616 [Frankiaceae bacterium]|nr:hypothetical protein [Frankiaceae bacterium]
MLSSSAAKSTDEYRLIFGNWCSLTMVRIVPLRERITSEWVVAPSGHTAHL